MPLKLKLAANERLVVNGAVLVNGSHRITLTVRNFAHILREKDVLQEEDADTPTKRLYFQVQAMLMHPPTPPALMADYRASLMSLRLAFSRPDNLTVLDSVEQFVEDGDHYKALTRLQGLIGVEATLLNVETPNWHRARMGAAALG